MKKRFWVPYEPYDVESIKLWLEEKAEEGFRLKKMKPYFAVFEDTDRQTLKYHLEPTIKDANKPDSGIVETRSDRGWTYAGTLTGHFHVFYADSKTPDYYEDKKSLKIRYEEKLKRERRAILWSILALITFILFGLDVSRYPIKWVIENFYYFQLLSLIFISFGTVTTVITYLKYKNYVRDLSEEREVYRLPSGIFRVLKCLGYGAYFLVFIVVMGSLIYGETQSSDDMLTDGLEIEPIVWAEEIVTSQSNERDDLFFDHYTYRIESFFLDQGLESFQFAYDGNSNYINLVTNYYDGKSEYIIKLLKNQLLTEIENTMDNPVIKAEMMSEIAITYIEDSYDEIMILNHEDRLLKIEHRGNGSLLDHKELLGKRLLQYQVP